MGESGGVCGGIMPSASGVGAPDSATASTGSSYAHGLAEPAHGGALSDAPAAWVALSPASTRSGSGSLAVDPAASGAPTPALPPSRRILELSAHAAAGSAWARALLRGGREGEGGGDRGLDGSGAASLARSMRLELQLPPAGTGAGRSSAPAVPSEPQLRSDARTDAERAGVAVAPAAGGLGAAMFARAAAAAARQSRLHECAREGLPRDGIGADVTTATPPSQSAPARAAAEGPQSSSLGYDGSARTQLAGAALPSCAAVPAPAATAPAGVIAAVKASASGPPVTTTTSASRLRAVLPPRDAPQPQAHQRPGAVSGGASSASSIAAAQRWSAPTSAISSASAAAASPAAEDAGPGRRGGGAPSSGSPCATGGSASGRGRSRPRRHRPTTTEGIAVD